jgi:hypothetical protein
MATALRPRVAQLINWTTWTVAVAHLDFEKCPPLLDSGRVGRLRLLLSLFNTRGDHRQITKTSDVIGS